MRSRLMTTGIVTHLIAALLTGPVSADPIAIWTNHEDNSRTGANLNETILNTSNVSVSTFGKLFTIPVDDIIYAQPLYIPGVSVNGIKHNMLFAATVSNSIYAFDADCGLPIWSKNYGPAPSVNDMGGSCGQQYPEAQLGIVGTPVIDTSTDTIYFVTRSKNLDGTYTPWIHALDIATGLDKFNSPHEITATSGGITFSGLYESQRAALALANGSVYVAWAAIGDCGDYHGWILAYKASDVSVLEHSFVDTLPSGSKGGIWMAGNGLDIDANGNLYFLTGNGLFDGVNNFGDSFVKLSPTLAVEDYFSPSDQATLDEGDIDLGSGGGILIPGTTNIVGGGKDGRFFLLDTNDMGKYHIGSDHVLQEFEAAASSILMGPVFWNSPLDGPAVYVWSQNDYGKAYQYSAGSFTSTPVAETADFNSTGWSADMALSANGSQPGTGILWTSVVDYGIHDVLRAYDASNLGADIWDSEKNDARDDMNYWARFTPPVIDNGKVYMAGGFFTPGYVCVYGLLGRQTASPSSLIGAGGEKSVMLSWSAGTGDTSYTVYRSTSPDNEGATPIATGLKKTTYLDTTVENDQIYYYVVTGSSVDGVSPPTNEVSALPLAAKTSTVIDPLNNWTYVSAHSARWKFDTSNPSEFNGDGSRITRTVDDSEYINYRYNGIVGFDARVYDQNGPIGMARYFISTDGVHFEQIPVTYEPAIFSTWNSYDIVPVGTLPKGIADIKIEFNPGSTNAGDSELGQVTIRYTGAPPAPAGLVATAENEGVGLAWDASGGGATSYDIFRWTTGAPTRIADVGGTTFMDTGLSNGKTYYYAVKAVNLNGSSVNSNVASATPRLEAPAGPTELVATVGNEQVTLKWAASLTATSYDICRGTSVDAIGSTPVGSTSALTFADTGLRNGATYYYVVKGANSIGTGRASAVVSASPHLTAPAPPTGLSASASSGKVLLKWNASVSATSYNAYRGTVSKGESASPIQSTSSTMYVNTGLTNGKTYYYVVKAVNAAGTSKASTEASASPE